MNEKDDEILINRQDKELEYLIEEWKEARVSIARFDTISTDLRKFGFSLTTFLITAYSIVFQIINITSPLPVVVAPFAIMLLVCGLFLADRYNEVLLLSSVLRCRQLEDTSHEIFENYIHSKLYLRLNLTTFIENRVQKAKARPFSFVIYFLFIVACISLGITFLLAFSQSANISISPFYWLILIMQAVIAIVFIAIINRNMSDLINSILDEVIIDDRIVIKKLFSEMRIEQTIKDLAYQIHHHYINDTFTILTIGNGGLRFAQRIISELKSQHDRINIPSIALFAKRVRVDEKNIKIEIEPPESHLILGRRIIIVDDLVSTGYTLMDAIQLCNNFSAKDVHTCVLLNATAKRKDENKGLNIDFPGLWTGEVGNFVGCGMDIQGECRDLPFIGIAKSFKPDWNPDQ